MAMTAMDQNLGIQWYLVSTQMGLSENRGTRKLMVEYHLSLLKLAVLGYPGYTV